MYLGTAVLLAGGAVLFGTLAVRESGYRKRMLLLGALPCAAMAVAYVMMGLEILTVTVTGTGGREQSMVRFVSYTVILVTVSYLLREVAGLSRQQFRVLCLALVGMTWSALFSWVTTGIAEMAASAGAFILYLASVYLFYGPLARVARGASGERQLLYLKLSHLAVLSWGTLILTSALSEQSAGVLDFFVGQFVASFVDLVFMLAFAGLLYHSKSLFDERRDASTPAGDTRDVSVAETLTETAPDENTPDALETRDRTDPLETRERTDPLETETNTN